MAPLVHRTLALAGVLVALTAAAGFALGLTTGSRTANSEQSGPSSVPAGKRAPQSASAGGDPASRPGVGRGVIRWRESMAVGSPSAGSLRSGVQFPLAGRSFFTWDPVLRQRANRPWRRWGTDELVRITLRVLRQFAAAHPRAPRIGVGDLSRPRGGDFGPRFGLPGHASHQNGLDVDLYYPRLDERERPPETPDQIDHTLAQDLVDRFVRAGAEQVFVGPSTRLEGPAVVVVPLVHHDNHLHVRLPA